MTNPNVIEYFEISFSFKGQEVMTLVVKQQTPEEVIYYAHINAEVSPLQNPQRFSFVDGAFNESLPDAFEDTPGLRNAIWQEIYSRVHR